jgi:hypothetical protein
MLIVAVVLLLALGLGVVALGWLSSDGRNGPAVQEPSAYREVKIKLLQELETSAQNPMFKTGVQRVLEEERAKAAAGEAGRQSPKP